MPIIIDHRTEDSLEQNFEDVNLFTENGEPTLEAEVIAGFIEELDWDAVMDDKDVREFVESKTGFYKTDEDGELVECDEKAEGAAEHTVETLDGELAWMFADTEDLVEMFKHYVANLPEGTLEEKARKAVFADLINEGALEEAPFKKGAFRKMHAAGGAAQVNRMLGAMIHKQSIKRSSPGKGYKGGDYTKDSGYAPGTNSGIKRWKAYKQKKSAELAKQAKKTLKAKKAAMKKVGYKVGTAPAQKKASAANLAKKAKAPKKDITASAEQTPANLNEDKTTPVLKRMEGVRLAGAIMEQQGTAKKPEKKPEGEKK